MDRSFLDYKLQSGYLHNWLVAGPQRIAVTKEKGMPPPDRQQVVTRYWQTGNEITEAPSELAKFSLATPAGATPETENQAYTWRYLACDDDHLLDLVGDDPSRTYLRSWAYAEIVSPQAQKARLTLHLFGPAQLWINDQPLLQEIGFHQDFSSPITAEIQLVEGPNTLLLRLEQFIDGPTPYGAALHLQALSKDTLKVRIPTNNEDTKKQQSIERLAKRAYLERDLYAGDETVTLKWPSSIQAERKLMVRVQTPAGFVSTQLQPDVKASLAQRVLEATSAKDGSYTIRVMADFDDFVSGFRVNHDLDVNLLHSDYSDASQPDMRERFVEMAQHAAWWTEGIFSEIAPMMLGLWKQVNASRILHTLDLALAGGEETDRLMIGFLLMAYRYLDIDGFPPTIAQRLPESILAFDYAVDAQGTDDPLAAGAEGINEDRAILNHACNLLAGQLYPDRQFAHSGQLGRWHQQRGEEAASAWLLRRAKGGFAAWDSGEGFELMLLGLVALVDHAESEGLSEMAAALIDKVLLTLAINSYKGIFGSTHGATTAASITDARMEPTSVVSRLLWGVGCWNQHMGAALALAGSQKYGCPPILQSIALDQAQELWSRERHITNWRSSNAGAQATDQSNTDQSNTAQANAGQANTGEVNKVTFKTPDYMLCSAQDYRAGEAGLNEHIWQATLSPSAVVFVNHPATLNQKPAYRPNFWCGNRSLPRVAQWRDLLIALYRLPSNDWLGYTHAHFPVAAFDESVIRRGWAFGRKGDGYLALTASAGMTQVKSGPGAYRELRSEAATNLWLCQMGRKAQDGSFADFQKAILAQPISYDTSTTSLNGASKNGSYSPLGVSLKTLRGETIAFAWKGPLTVNGAEQPLSGFNHYDNPYVVSELGAVEMEVRYEEYLLRLNLTPDEE